MVIPLDRKGFRLLVRYKCNSSDLFTPVKKRNLLTVLDWSEDEIRTYAEHLRMGYVRSMRCYEGRVEFRDNYVHPHLRDDNHEKAISAAKLRCQEYADALSEVLADLSALSVPY